MRARAGVAIAVVALVASGAFAIRVLGHAKENRATVVKDDSDSTHADNQCAVGIVRVADGNYDKGFARSITISASFWHSNYCGRKKTKHRGSIGSKFTYQKRKGGRWRKCRSSRWHYNKTRTDTVTVWRDFRRLPCGKGRYRTKAHYKVKYRGKWVKGTITSPVHRFPSK
jgi:hypothetical protein